MPFLRSGHDGTFASPILIPSLFSPSRRNFGLLSLLSFSAVSMASASSKPSKPFKPIGVEAWTSGSQTFIRARPGATVPPVAKVERHTPLHVWGKYNGWYRVETHDHIFGWVFNQYLNSPSLDKVREMPRAKARIASNRTANQTMYGTPEMLKKHFITYGAPGALRGLQKQGVYLAVAPKPAPKPKTLLALKAASASKTSKTRLAAVSPGPRVAPAPRNIESSVAPSTLASPVPVVEAPRRLETSPAEVAVPRPAPAATLNADPVSPAPREVEVGKIAGASRDLVPAARTFARAAGEAASQPPVMSSGAAPAVPVAPRPVAPRPVAVTPAPHPVPRVATTKPRVAAKPKVTKKAKKTVAKAPPRGRYSAWKTKRREQLRTKMGLSPAPMPPTVIAPVSPSELLKARQEYLSERKARLNPPVPQTPAPQQESPGTPVGNLAPLPTPSGPLGGPQVGGPQVGVPPSGGPQGGYLPPTPPALQPMAFEGEFDLSLPPLYPILANPTVVALSQIKPKAPFRGTPVGLTPLYPAPTALRGGSPRDRFGSGMANQALSYRGMPYIRGAASPKRGFDCSGLVYFLLRQRGYNPPRTAAGYRNWGASVPRTALQPGDLLLFANTYKRGISHIGVYLGQNKFVHAATSGTGVRVSSLNEAYYRGKYFGARRAKLPGQKS